MKKIINITKEKLEYLNENNEKCYICFSECNNNWINYRLKTEPNNHNNFSELKRKDNCVGQRNSDANPIFIEFFTQPFTKFIFEGKDAKEEYNKIRDSIFKNDWNTLDLT